MDSTRELATALLWKLSPCVKAVLVLGCKGLVSDDFFESTPYKSLAPRLQERTDRRQNGEFTYSDIAFVTTYTQNASP